MDLNKLPINLTNNIEQEKDIFMITIDNKLLINIEEFYSYSLPCPSDFESYDEYQREILEKITTNVDINKKNPRKTYDIDLESYVQIYVADSALEKYSVGESEYWKNLQKRPHSIDEIVNHYKKIFPLFEVNAVKIHTSTKIVEHINYSIYK